MTHLPARHAATNVRARLAAQGLVLHQPEPLASGCAQLGIESGERWACMLHYPVSRDGVPAAAYKLPHLSFPAPSIPRYPADSRVPWFNTMDAACQYCEEHFLSAAVAHGLCPPPARRMTLAQVSEGLGSHSVAGLVSTKCRLNGSRVLTLTAEVLVAACAAVRELALHQGPPFWPSGPRHHPCHTWCVQVLQANLELPRCVQGAAAEWQGKHKGHHPISCGHYSQRLCILAWHPETGDSAARCRRCAAGSLQRQLAPYWASRPVLMCADVCWARCWTIHWRPPCCSGTPAKRS